MKKFSFRFTAVETIRQSKEEAALSRLGASQRALQQERLKKLEILKQIEDSLMRRELLAEKVASPTFYKLETDYIFGSKIRLEQQDRAIFRTHKNYEKALRDFLFCRKQSLIIQKLREKDESEYRVSYRKYEQKRADDLTIMRSRIIAKLEEGSE